MDRSSASKAAIIANMPTYTPIDQNKKYVSGAFKFLETDEQRAQALAAAASWKARFAEEPRWRETVSRIARFAQEDHLRTFGTKSAPITSTPALPPPSGLTAASGAHVLRPAHLPRIETMNPTTPRARWDIVASGPIAPLTPSPMGNAFARGGFWESFTPTTPQPTPSGSPTPVTAMTAMSHGPWLPIVPESDPEARAAYDHIKRDVINMALKMCANRLSVHHTCSSKHDFIHPSLVRTKDELHAAEFTLQSRVLDVNKHLNTEIVETLARFADEEANISGLHRITSIAGIEDIDAWLRVDDKTFEFTTSYDEMRDQLHMNRERRKIREVRLSDAALQYAWATKILQDTEEMYRLRDDNSSTYSDEDTGYDYSNFLHSLRHDGSSTTDVTSTLSESNYETESSRSSGMNTDLHCGTRSRQTNYSVRSSTSPTKHQHRSSPLRTSTSPKPHPSAPQSMWSRDTRLPKQSNASRVHEQSHTRDRSTKALSISTSFHHAENQTPELTPEEKSFRHHGPSFQDLTVWAQELKKMEEYGNAARQSRTMTMLPDNSNNNNRCPAYRCSRHNKPEDSADTVRNGDAEECHAQPTVLAGATLQAPLSTLPLHNHNTRVPASDSALVQEGGARPRSSIGLSRTACKEEEDEWGRELRKMESRERIRQLAERDMI